MNNYDTLYLDLIDRDGAPTQEDLERAEYLRSIEEEPHE